MSYFLTNVQQSKKKSTGGTQKKRLDLLFWLYLNNPNTLSSLNEKSDQECNVFVLTLTSHSLTVLVEPCPENRILRPRGACFLPPLTAKCVEVCQPCLSVSWFYSLFTRWTSRCKCLWKVKRIFALATFRRLYNHNFSDAYLSIFNSKFNLGANRVQIDANFFEKNYRSAQENHSQTPANKVASVEKCGSSSDNIHLHWNRLARNFGHFDGKIRLHCRSWSNHVISNFELIFFSKLLQQQNLLFLHFVFISFWKLTWINRISVFIHVIIFHLKDKFVQKSSKQSVVPLNCNNFFRK